MTKILQTTLHEKTLEFMYTMNSHGKKVKKKVL